MTFLIIITQTLIVDYPLIWQMCAEVKSVQSIWFLRWNWSRLKTTTYLFKLLPVGSFTAHGWVVFGDVGAISAILNVQLLHRVNITVSSKLLSLCIAHSSQNATNHFLSPSYSDPQSSMHLIRSSSNKRDLILIGSLQFWPKSETFESIIRQSSI